MVGQRSSDGVFNSLVRICVGIAVGLAMLLFGYWTISNFNVSMLMHDKIASDVADNRKMLTEIQQGQYLLMLEMENARLTGDNRLRLLPKVPENLDVSLDLIPLAAHRDGKYLAKSADGRRLKISRAQTRTVRANVTFNGPKGLYLVVFRWLTPDGQLAKLSSDTPIWGARDKHYYTSYGFGQFSHRDNGIYRLQIIIGGKVQAEGVVELMD